MKVYITWSGERSKALANILQRWLRSVIQGVTPYFSPDDLAKGTRWTPDIAKELSDCRLGLICLTKENLDAPWVLFEAGALSKNLDNSKVCPILFGGLKPTDLEGPLAQFQAATFQKAEMKRVVTMLNTELAHTQLGEASMPPELLDNVFDKWWPELDQDVTEQYRNSIPAPLANPRSDRDLLEEILQLTRSSSMPAARILPDSDVVSDLVMAYAHIVDVASQHQCLDPLEQPLLQLSKPIEYLCNAQNRETPLTKIFWEATFTFVKGPQMPNFPLPPRRRNAPETKTGPDIKLPP